ncbi:T9SS type A sorting domain-containing protein [bacterium]|nr:T9SS type A sorting domain-containing protein [bacterium]
MKNKITFVFAIAIAFTIIITVTYSYTREYAFTTTNFVGEFQPKTALASSYFAYDYEFKTEIIHPDSGADFLTTLTNDGSSRETYTLTIELNADDGWVASFCTETGCFPFTADVTLSPAEVETVTVDAYPLGSRGQALLSMIISSESETDTTVFKIISGVTVLLVDDDQGDPYEYYYIQCLDTLDVCYGVFDRTERELTPQELSYSEAIVWFTGTPTDNTLEAADETALTSFLNNGGKLFISSFNLGKELDELGRLSFHQDYLHAEYLNHDLDFTEMMDIEGIPDDVISDDIYLFCVGGDGADNMNFPDQIAPFDESAITIFQYSYGESLCGDAGIRIETEMYKTVYLSFAFEAIDNFDDRAYLMRQVLNWFGIETGIDTENNIHPVSFEDFNNYPNPFNASTTIRFAVANESMEPATVEFYNITGELLNSQNLGKLTTGIHDFEWNATDQRGHFLPNGIYFAKISVAKNTIIVKMILAK